MRERNAVVLRLQLLGDQQIVFRLEEICTIVNGEFKVVAMRDCILRTGFHAVAAKDTTTIIDVVNLGVTFINADALFGRTRIVGSHDVNTLGRTRSSAEITRNAFFPPELVNVQQVLAAITRLNGNRFVWIFDRPLPFRNIGKRHTHSLDDRFGRFNNVGDD